MEKVLIVEDSRLFSNVLVTEISHSLGLDCLTASTLKMAQELVKDNEFIAAVLDLNLPDAPNGEVVDYIIENEIPVIVLTGNLKDDTRDRILEKHVTDYIIKEGTNSIAQVVNGITRILRNTKTTVLVVDDSSVSRKMIRMFLEIQRFHVLEAENGQEGLEVLDAHPEIKLVVTDYTMPVMDGFELVSEIRKNYTLDQLAIIGISAQGNPILSAKFLKKGANDFLTKPFSEEEFFWRVNQNVEILDYISQIKKIATHDYLTGLFNRRYLFDIGNTLFENTKRDNIDISIAIIDIDFFKHINDKYGHLCGDRVLKTVAQLISSHFRSSDIVARYGGEEFCIITANISPENCFTLFERLRKKIEKEIIVVGENILSLTISIGVQATICETLEETVNSADKLLYKAKTTGRNKTFVSTIDW